MPWLVHIVLTFSVRSFSLLVYLVRHQGYTHRAPRDAPTLVGQLDADGSTTMNGVKMNDTTMDSIASPIEAEDMEKDDVSEII